MYGQTWAINDCLFRNREQGTAWTLFVDVDEFISLPGVPGGLTGLADALEQRRYESATFHSIGYLSGACDAEVYDDPVVAGAGQAEAGGKRERPLEDRMVVRAVYPEVGLSPVLFLYSFIPTRRLSQSSLTWLLLLLTTVAFSTAHCCRGAMTCGRSTARMRTRWRSMAGARRVPTSLPTPTPRITCVALCRGPGGLTSTGGAHVQQVFVKPEAALAMNVHALMHMTDAEMDVLLLTRPGVQRGDFSEKSRALNASRAWVKHVRGAGFDDVDRDAASRPLCAGVPASCEAVPEGLQCPPEEGIIGGVETALINPTNVWVDERPSLVRARGLGDVLAWSYDQESWGGAVRR